MVAGVPEEWSGVGLLSPRGDCPLAGVLMPATPPSEPPRDVSPLAGRPTTFLLRHPPPRPGGGPWSSHTGPTGKDRRPDGLEVDRRVHSPAMGDATRTGPLAHVQRQLLRKDPVADRHRAQFGPGRAPARSDGVPFLTMLRTVMSSITTTVGAWLLGCSSLSEKSSACTPGSGEHSPTTHKKPTEQGVAMNTVEPFRRTFLELPQGRLAVVTAGERGAPVLLLTGGGADNALISWRHLLPDLAADHRVLALDWPHRGHSTPWSGSADHQALVEVVRQVLDHFAVDRVALVGLSQGATVALAQAAAHPDRVERVVALAPGGIAPYPPLMHQLLWLVARSRLLHTTSTLR